MSATYVTYTNLHNKPKDTKNIQDIFQYSTLLCLTRNGKFSECKAEMCKFSKDHTQHIYACKLETYCLSQSMEASLAVFLDTSSPQTQPTDCHSQQFPESENSTTSTVKLPMLPKILPKIQQQQFNSLANVALVMHSYMTEKKFNKKYNHLKPITYSSLAADAFKYRTKTHPYLHKTKFNETVMKLTIFKISKTDYVLEGQTQ